MKKYIVLIIAFMMSVWSMNAEAATGTIEIQLQESSDTKVMYAKVATMVNGLWELDEKYKESKVDINALETAVQVEETAKTLIEYMDVAQTCSADGQDKILLQNLETGLYLITFTSSNEISVRPTLIAIPGWSGEEMTYHMKVIPKYQEKTKTPLTGWNSHEEIYLGMIAISLVIIAGLSCHKRFKCGKITSNI